MSEYWLSLTDIPSDGREYAFLEQSFWEDPIIEFELPYRILTPLQGTVFLLPQKDGCYISGRLRGRITMPCARCAEDAGFDVDTRFEIFEKVPEQREEPIGPCFLRRVEDHLELDIAGILWEQFLLALPVKYLCIEACAGICPHCGQNLNRDLCLCDRDQRDPRLEIFRKLKVS
jgi:uncharacterized protein